MTSISPLLDELDEEEIQDEIRKLEVEEVNRLQNHQYKYYEPNGKCEEFIEEVGLGKTFIILFSAANGVGKTAAGANVIAHFAFESDNPYFEYPLFKKFPFPKKGRIVTDPKNTTGVIDTLKEWLPKDRYNARKAGKNYESEWTTETGWKWDIMSYDQDPKEFEGPTLGFAWFDEPPPEAIFKATVARMRKGGVIFITATPLTGSAWMYDHLVAPKARESSVKGQRAYIQADVEAACKQHGVRGHLEHKHIQKMIGEYSEDEMQARVKGMFQHLVGLVFKQFDRKIHVIPAFKISKKDYTVYEALDPHPRNPDMVNWMAVDKNGTKIIVDELWIKAKTSSLAKRIDMKADRYRVEKRIADPSAFVEDKHDADPERATLAAKLKDHGLEYEPATKARTRANRRIGDALDYEVRGKEFIVAPEMYIFDTCLRTIFEFEHFQWDEWKGRTAEDKKPKEKTKDKDDHSIENIGRLLLLEPEFTEYHPEESGMIIGKDPKSFDPY